MRAKTSDLTIEQIQRLHWRDDPAYTTDAAQYTAKQRELREVGPALDGAALAVQDCRQRCERAALFREHQRGSDRDVQQAQQHLADAERTLRGLQFKRELLQEDLPTLNPIASAHAARRRVLAQLTALQAQWTHFVMAEARGLPEVRRGMAYLQAIATAAQANFRPHVAGPMNRPPAPEVDDGITSAGGLPYFILSELLGGKGERVEAQMRAYLEDHGGGVAE